MRSNEEVYKFTYLHSTLYTLSIIIFAFMWWSIIYLLIKFNISLYFMEHVPTIWIPFYMIAGIVIPSFVLLKPLSGIAVGKIREDSVEIEFKHSSFQANYNKINKIYYSYGRNSRSMHIELSFLKEKVISQRLYKDESLHLFYLELNHKFNDYKALSGCK